MTRNLLIIINANIRLTFKQTLLPAVVLLLIIPMIYGTSNLDSIQSADCLERMVALIGLPMFVPLLKSEQREGIESLITLRSFPYRLIIVIRICLSLVCAFILILAFEFYLSVCRCTFPVCSYAIRTLVASMLLGFVGLLTSAASKNTAVGYLVAFGLYCILQTGILSSLFSPVSSGMNIRQIMFLLGCVLASAFLANNSTG